MRLAQLARKLSVKPTDLLEFLSSHSIVMEDSANAKVEEEHVRMLVSHYAPHLLEAQVEELTQQEDEIIVVGEADLKEEISSEEPTPEQIQEESPLFETVPAETEELPEIIRAPKIELSGLKVLGKIELPEKKKKEEASAEVSAEASVTEPEKSFIARERRPAKDRERKAERRPSRNPLAEARERERREEEEKRKAEIERRKAVRTQKYLKKVQTSPPLKKAKAETPAAMKPVLKKEVPKSLWGKFVHWLTSY